MSGRRKRSNISQALLCMVVGGLCGAGIALFFAPSSGDKTRHYLKMKTEWARRRAGSMTAGFRETIEYLVAEMRELTARLLEGGTELTRETRDDLLSAIESGKRAMEEEKKRLARGQTRQRDHAHNSDTV